MFGSGISNSISGISIVNEENQGGKFANDFFVLANLPVSEKSNQKIRDHLKTLEKSGYQIDRKWIIHGKDGLTYWPCLQKTGRGLIAAGMSTAVRGSHGSGSCSLEDYLNFLIRLESDSNQIDGSSSFSPLAPEQRVFSTQKDSGLRDVVKSSSLQTPVQHSSVVSTRSDDTLTENQWRFLEAWHPSNAGMSTCVVCWSSIPLSKLRRLGVFVGEHPVSCNPFTVDDLLNCTFTEYQNGKQLIRREGKILACSLGLVIQPQISPGYFDHGSHVTDEPCKDQVKVTVHLTNRDHLIELLPYLNGIPAYPSR